MLNLRLVPVVALTLAIPATVLGVSDCAAVPAITKTVVDEVQCVEGEVAKGDDTFEDIALACAPLAVEDAITIVTSLASPPDGGASDVAAKAARVHHKGH